LSYVEQFRRMERFLGRIENDDRGADDYDDDLWSFFQHCWHLKDWVANDDALPQDVRDRVASTVHSNRSLMVCADLANRTKHLKLTKMNRHDARVTQRNTTVYLGNPVRSTSEHIITLRDGTTLVALDLARRAVEDWRQILQGERLAT
jgi:hypothetical protein